MNFDQEKLENEIQQVDAIQWRNELKRELANQSDRAVAIVCASILDTQLSDMLKNFMIDDKNIKKDLLEGNSPLSTFSAKIKTAYYLGLISEDEYKNLDTLRKIRNDFAHQLINISFDNNQSIKARCNNLYIPKNRYVPEVIPRPTEDGKIPKLNLDPFAEDNSPKNRFVQVFYFLSLNFLQRNFEIVNMKREKYVPTMTTAEIHRNIRDTYLSAKDKIIQTQLEINERRKALGQEEKIFETDQSEISKLIDKTIEDFGYIADVLENSYEK